MASIYWVLAVCKALCCTCYLSPAQWTLQVSRIYTLPGRTVNLSQVRWLARGHTAGNWQSWDSDVDLIAPRPDPALFSQLTSFHSCMNPCTWSNPSRHPCGPPEHSYITETLLSLSLNNFIYFQLFWGFIAALTFLELRWAGATLHWCAGFSLRWLLFLPGTGSRAWGLQYLWVPGSRG